jgi:hypothetical protein
MTGYMTHMIEKKNLEEIMKDYEVILASCSTKRLIWRPGIRNFYIYFGRDKDYPGENSFSNLNSAVVFYNQCR